MKVLILVDWETQPSDDTQFEGKDEATKLGMEYQVIQALRDQGHAIEVLSFGPDILQTMTTLREKAPDLVFNLTEHVGGDRRKDAHIAAMLELLGIPFTGTSTIGLMLCRDKGTCKRVLGYHHIRLPAFEELQVGRTKPAARLKFPMIVKPMYEDGSDGISLSSIVRTAEELQERVSMVHERMKQSALCEEFIEGREIYVAILGNERLQALPPRELHFGKTDEGGPTIATARVKWNEKYRKKWGISYGHAELDPALEKKVSHFSKRVFRLLNMRDYGRIDLRITPQNEVVFLEANPNPNLGNDEDVAEAARKAGIEYAPLIDRIVQQAAKRRPATTQAKQG